MNSTTRNNSKFLQYEIINFLHRVAGHFLRPILSFLRILYTVLNSSLFLPMSHLGGCWVLSSRVRSSICFTLLHVSPWLSRLGVQNAITSPERLFSLYTSSAVNQYPGLPHVMAHALFSCSRVVFLSTVGKQGLPSC